MRRITHFLAVSATVLAHSTGFAAANTNEVLSRLTTTPVSQFNFGLYQIHQRLGSIVSGRFSDLGFVTGVVLTKEKCTGARL